MKFNVKITPLTLKICDRLQKGETSALSKAITTSKQNFLFFLISKVESTTQSDYHQAQYILNFIKNKKINSLRIGITGEE
jgi:putative protein kinase ArgK-like GTPase of G3E family